MWRPSNPGGPGLPHNVQRNQGMPPPQQQVGECVSLLCMHCSMKGIGKGTWGGGRGVMWHKAGLHLFMPYHFFLVITLLFRLALHLLRDIFWDPIVFKVFLQQGLWLWEDGGMVSQYLALIQCHYQTDHQGNSFQDCTVLSSLQSHNLIFKIHPLSPRLSTQPQRPLSHQLFHHGCHHHRGLVQGKP